ncbi:MAG: nucleoside diphosphate kinase regulator [Phenylobacterium sp.]|uniref:nucleoside diphosphate kinase regulator n=1 Tax=Phenylobacterium sp. TaxID=1871053 RepID=UPI00391928AB
MPSPATEHARPDIVLAQSEAARLSALALSLERSAPFAAGLLLQEIDRAEIRPDGAMPPDVVRMHSTLQFVDSLHGRPRTVMLVYPAEADISAGKVSVMTPVGAGLIGLPVRQPISWPDLEGRERLLEVVKVRPPTKLRF